MQSRDDRFRFARPDGNGGHRVAPGYSGVIHYTGNNAVFLPPEHVLPLVANCVADHRKYVALAVGWVLREVGQVYSDEVTKFLERHAASMSSRAYARAVEKRAPKERARLSGKRKARSG